MTLDNSGRSFAYNSKNLLASSSNNGVITTFGYDASNRLLRVTHNGSTRRFLYDGNRIIAEYNSSGVMVKRYVYGPNQDEPILWFDGAGFSAKRFLLSDEKGSIVAVTSNLGSLLSRNSYDIYGNKQTSNNSYTGKFGYTGQYFLSEVGLHYFKARMYNSKLGRFMQTDPSGYSDGMNLYSYVGGDPVNRVDPTGLFGSIPLRTTDGDNVDAEIIVTARRDGSGSRCTSLGCTTMTGRAAEWITFRMYTQSRLASPTGMGIRNDAGGYGYFGAPRGSRNHAGIDFQTTEGGVIVSPVTGTIVYFNGATQGYPMADITPSDVNLAFDFIRVLYINAPGEVNLGQGYSVSGGDMIGTAANLQDLGYSSKVTPHVHVEVWSGGQPINPGGSFSFY